MGQLRVDTRKAYNSGILYTYKTADNVCGLFLMLHKCIILPLVLKFG